MGGSSSGKDGAVEASLYARQEKRRLIDLGNVLMQRQRFIDDGSHLSMVAAVIQQGGTDSDATAEPSSHEREFEAKLKEIRMQTESLITGEKKRTKSELLTLVQDEAKQLVRQEQEVQRVKDQEEASTRKRIEQDAKRREAFKRYDEQREAWQEKVRMADEKRLEETQRKLKQQMTQHEERLAAHASLAKQEFQRRAGIEKARMLEVRARHQANFEAAKQADSHRGERMATAEAFRNSHGKGLSFKAGSRKVIAVMEGDGDIPKKIARVRARREAEQTRRAELMRQKAEQEQVRLGASMQVRAAATAMRREAAEQRSIQHDELLSKVREMDKLYKEAVKSKVDSGGRNVDALHARVEKWKDERRQLSAARDEEKRLAVERVNRAREFASFRVFQKQQGIIVRADELRAQRAQQSSACRSQANRIHYMREELKEALALSPKESLGTLRKQSALLSDLGVNVSELEEAAHKLRGSKSAPTLCPSSAMP
jgi:hypothetical protein